MPADGWKSYLGIVMKRVLTALRQHGRFVARGQGGQAAVESAIIMTLMVFMVLGVVQLTMLHHAKLMTRYAAYSAARAGIVYNADKDKMEAAAFIALLPTYGFKTNDMGNVLKGAAIAYGKKTVMDMLSQLLGSGLRQIGGSSGWQAAARNLKMIEVETLNPTSSHFGGKREIDFDAVDTQSRQANRLSIRVRYLYEMRIPFANWVFHDFWVAHQVINFQKSINVGPISAKAEAYGYGGGFIHDGRVSAGGSVGLPGFSVGGSTTLTRPASVMTVTAGAVGKSLWGKNGMLATLRALWHAGLYFMPIESYYTMRMQSNLYRKNIP